MLGLSSIFLFNIFLHVFCNSTKTCANSSEETKDMFQITCNGKEDKLKLRHYHQHRRQSYGFDQGQP